MDRTTTTTESSIILDILSILFTNAILHLPIQEHAATILAATTTTSSSSWKDARIKEDRESFLLDPLERMIHLFQIFHDDDDINIIL